MGERRRGGTVGLVLVLMLVMVVVVVVVVMVVVGWSVGWMDGMEGERSGMKTMTGGRSADAD